MKSNNNNNRDETIYTHEYYVYTPQVLCIYMGATIAYSHNQDSPLYTQQVNTTLSHVTINV